MASLEKHFKLNTEWDEEPIFIQLHPDNPDFIQITKQCRNDYEPDQIIDVLTMNREEARLLCEALTDLINGK